MAFPESCFQSLIGIRGICEPVTAQFYLDDIPGIDLTRLANMAEGETPTGKKLGDKLIESAARFMAADVEAIYDSHYKVVNTLGGGCSSCSFTTTGSAGVQRGILIKDNTTSSLSVLMLDKLEARLTAPGLFHIVIDDGNPDNLKVIEHTFEANVDYEFVNLGYSTKKKQLKVYMQESDAQMSQLSCPRANGCGCGGGKTIMQDLVYTGLTNGAETQQAYGFKPCASIRCDASDLLCYVAQSAPRMIGMGMLYKTAELYFQTKIHSNRNNKTVGQGKEESKEGEVNYSKLYTQKLNGTAGRGVKDVVYTTLQNSDDICVVCDSLTGIAWATG